MMSSIHAVFVYRVIESQIDNLFLRLWCSDIYALASSPGCMYLLDWIKRVHCFEDKSTVYIFGALSCFNC